MQIKFFAIVIVIMSLLTTIAFAADYPPAKQTIFLKFPDGVTPWHIESRSMTAHGYIVTMYPQGQNPSSWTEVINMAIIPYTVFPDVTANKFLQRQIKSGKANCASVITRTITQSAKSITHFM